MLLDPLNDAMSTIRNAELAGKGECNVRPASKLIGRVLTVMQDSGYVTGFERVDDGRGGIFHIRLKGSIHHCGVIKPRLRVKRTALAANEAPDRPAPAFCALILTKPESVI